MNITGLSQPNTCFVFKGQQWQIWGGGGGGGGFKGLLPPGSPSKRAQSYVYVQNLDKMHYCYCALAHKPIAMSMVVLVVSCEQVVNKL